MSKERLNLKVKAADPRVRGIDSNEGSRHAEMLRFGEEMLAALKRLSSAALARDATMGDPCRLIEVRAELADANRQAMAVLAAAA